MLYFFKKIMKNISKFHSFTPAYQKYWWYDPQFLRYKAWQTKIGIYGSLFALLPSSKNQKNQNFEKIKKFLEISSFYMCTQNTIIWGMVPRKQNETGGVPLYVTCSVCLSIHQCVAHHISGTVHHLIIISGTFV